MCVGSGLALWVNDRVRSRGLTFFTMFKFDFGGQDAEPDASQGQPHAESSLVPAQLCSLEYLSQHEPRISYTKDSFGIPRRDLFDVRYELMSADDMSEEEKLLLSGTEDVRKNVYEGGLKVWEGTNDLLEVLSASTQQYTNCAELGCGAGLPICFLFHKALTTHSAGKYVLADYNSAVLRLLTMPNVVLSWLAATNNAAVQEYHGELVISQEMVRAMLEDLRNREIEVLFVAGAWSSDFSSLIGNDAYDLVLASETIYSLDSIKEFTSVLQSALKPESGVGLVAAKKIYFGVGGGVVEFELLLDQRFMAHKIIYEKGSVGRVVLQVSK